MNGGFICVPREVWEWDNWPRRDAYIDLQKRACWGEQEQKSKGQSVTVYAGEVLFSVPAAALWWRCSEKAVRLWMEWLEAQNLIAYPEGKQHRRMFRVALLDFWGASKGANGGASKGASKRNVETGLRGAGARTGAPRGARAGARYKEDEFIDERDITVPTVPCAGGAGDLFGEQAPAPPPAPSEPEPEKPSVIARRVVSLFHDLSKANGGNGVSGTMWGAQQKMAETALKNGLTEQQATEALRWGWREEYQRTRLRAHGMKVLIDVWSAWVEHTGGTNGRNGNGRNGAGHAGGEAGAGEGTGSGPTGYSIVGGMATRYPEARRHR